ncbi:MAG: zinc ribbon domain-containing protein [Candidatus Thorarchaeota archaeon]
MPEPVSTQATISSVFPKEASPFKGKDWLANASFGTAFQRSILLLKQQFLKLFLIFFIGGFILSVILLPVDSLIIAIDTLIANEILAPVPDFFLLFDLLILSMAWGFLQKFMIFFGAFILWTLSIYHLFKTESSLQILLVDESKVRFPINSTILAAFITSIILTFASVIPILITILQMLFFFLPMILVLGQFSLTKSFTLSIGMRVQHWGRILSILILGYVLITFAGVLGSTIYLNIETIFSLYGITLGLAGLIALSIFTQIPVAMVAPIIPLFSVVFFGGARGAYREKQHQKYMHQVQIYQPPQHLNSAPSRGKIHDEKSICQYCGKQLEPDLAFCTQCGKPIKYTQ